jgi:deoxyribonuclease V
MRYQEIHRWDVAPAEGSRIQNELRERVVLQNDFSRVDLVAGADMSIDKSSNEGFAGVIVYTFPGLNEVERRHAHRKLTFPYIPGLLAFREAPVLLGAFAKLENEPDVIIFDGQGIAHQRGLGIATHMGLVLDKPTIGCAKSRLVGSFEEPGNEVGDHSALVFHGNTVGAVLRTRKNVNPIFVSQGHKIGLETCVDILLQCGDGYRIPKPTREADHFVGEIKRAPSTARDSSQLSLGF